MWPGSVTGSWSEQIPPGSFSNASLGTWQGGFQNRAGCGSSTETSMQSGPGENPPSRLALLSFYAGRFSGLRVAVGVWTGWFLLFFAALTGCRENLLEWSMAVRPLRRCRCCVCTSVALSACSRNNVSAMNLAIYHEKNKRITYFDV